MIDLKALLDTVTKYQSSISFNNLDYEAMVTGLKVSRQALMQPEDISLTPYAKNAMAHLDKKGYLLVTDKVTKMEQWFEEETLKLLRKYCPNESTSYNFSAPAWDKANYDVDCWRNFKRGIEIRHARPDMNKEREEKFAAFYKPSKRLDILKITEQYPSATTALELMDASTPRASKSKDWRKISLPYMTKHTNVGYPYFTNDQAKTPTGETYAQLTDRQARSMRPQDVANYPYTAFGRNLRGKARQIMGGSRLQALVFNQLEATEIENYKTSNPLFIGYNDDTVVRDKLVIVGNWLRNNTQWTCMNRDYSNFDISTSVDLRRLIDAFSIYKAEGKDAKEIAFWRAAAHSKSLLVNGWLNRIKPIYCRIFSGEIDTNRAGGLINAFVDLTAMVRQAPDFVNVYNELWSKGTSALWVMGDDNMIVQPKKFDNKKYESFISQTFGLEVSHDKGEHGLFFLQRRLFLDKDRKWVFITPFTRVIRGLISKERRKGLGPAGWTLAAYQLLAQLKEWPALMCDVARIFAKWDDLKLGTKMSVKQLLSMVTLEDKESASKDGYRYQPTAVKLYDGDPLKAKMFNGDAEKVSEDFVSEIHRLLIQGRVGD